MGESPAVTLTRSLVECDTQLGNEARAARILAPRLEAAGLDVCVYHDVSGARAQIVAVAPGRQDDPALTLSGHLDTVPPGDLAAWTRRPEGEVDGDRLFGLGTSDMKGGVAAFVVALERLMGSGKRPGRSVQLVLSYGEETGCEGAVELVEHRDALRASDAILVAEPTSNRVGIGHKGVLWMRLYARGRTAHGSVPWRGTNAIYPLARAVAGLAAHVTLPFEEHDCLGSATANVGLISGGRNVNSVPDHAEAWLDCRLVPGVEPEAVSAHVRALVGGDVEVEIDRMLPPVMADAGHAWPQAVRAAVESCGMTGEPLALGYFTDASILGPHLNATAVVCGPGEAGLAHTPDESCSMRAIEQAVELYSDLIATWCRW